MKKLNKKGQEEMLGFALIIIVVAVVLLVFLAISLSNNKKENVESYEVESFLQALLQHTSDCENNLEYLDTQKLIFSCIKNENCLDGRKTCDVLNSTINELLKESWKVEGDRPVKGYSINIYSENSTILNFQEGNKTINSKGALQDFSRSGKLIEIIFNAYY